MTNIGTQAVLGNIKNAQKNISQFVFNTPLYMVDWLSKEMGMNVFLKMESEQNTGSFKLRGAANAIMNLHNTEKPPKVYAAASTGSHGIACAYMTAKIGAKLILFVGTDISKEKEEYLLSFPNVKLVKKERDFASSYVKCKIYSQEKSYPFISTLNSWDVIYGQATIGLEILEQMPNLDLVIAPVGSGSLICGLTLYFKNINPNIKVIGCEPVVDDGTFGVAGYNVKQDNIAFNFCKECIHRWISPHEEDIERATYDMLAFENKITEGGSGQVIASLRMLGEEYKGKNVALIMCGKRLGIKNIKYLIDKYDKK